MTEQLSVNQQMRMDESSKTNSVDHSMINGSDNQTMDQSGNNQALNDPVTKAVVDNIMGNLPTKKPFYRCDDCDLSFTSNAVLDAHLQGARHAKQIRSRNIMATLDESKIPFAKDAETNGLQCNVCSVRLNSLQQLHTHLNGNRHKKKAIRGNKSTGVKTASNHSFKTRRTSLFDQMIRKETVVLVYCLIVFTFACLTLLLTFVFHVYIM